MESIGIIAEYNPFHNGHLYHLSKIKEKYKDTVIVLIMSGNFTQRGGTSLIDKWKKTEIALKAGIDLIVELPYPFATQSADYFSYGSITLLEKLKVKKLLFGSECDDITTLETIASAQINNEDFDKLVKIYSKLGKNYPTAISLAVKDLTQKEINALSKPMIRSVLSTRRVEAVLSNAFFCKGTRTMIPLKIHQTHSFFLV